jgi:hypothetical protein
LKHQTSKDRMKGISHGVSALLLAMVVCGCFTHTVVGNGNGVASPDGRYTLRIQSHGASRQAYVDMSKKRVYLWIATITKYDSLHVAVIEPSVTVLDKKYTFTAGDLCSSVRWQGSQEVAVDFYDFGDRVSSYDAEKASAPSNHVATLAFVLDAKSGRFSEKK